MSDELSIADQLVEHPELPIEAQRIALRDRLRQLEELRKHWLEEQADRLFRAEDIESLRWEGDVLRVILVPGQLIVRLDTNPYAPLSMVAEAS
jgi:hypothetical protein